MAKGLKSGRRARDSLRFVPSGKVVGFRASGLSAYNNVDPHTVIRELVQNSLDAGRKAKRKVVRVVFEIDEVDARKIPSRAEYRAHLQSAVDAQMQKGNLEQSRSIVEAMRSSIDASRVPVLWVLDNGVGLDDQGMEDLLGDGQSGKADESSAGSYGNGHMTSFPASDLRYVVYGGVHKGGRTVSGHAILASHVFGRKVCGEDGYLARKIRPNDLFDRFDFPDGATTPLLKDKLDHVEERFGTGSVVGILGFNRFNRFSSDEEVRRVVETVVATHFTPVIRDGGMEVATKIAGNDEEWIKTSGLEGILEERRERERRDRNSIGPSGRQAWETLGTLAPTHRHTIETRAGKVRFHFRALHRGDGGGTHVQLFRNGMWITNYVPHNRPSDFRQREPFCGVVLLEPEQAALACGLVGDFEGPRHIDIDLTRQKPGTKRRRALQEFLRELHAGIERLVPELDLVEHDPGFFSIEVTGDGIQNNPRPRAGGTGTPEPVRPRSPGGGGNGGGGGGVNPDRPGAFRRQGTRIEARVTALKRTRGVRLRAKVMEEAQSAELRVVLADGSDDTCDSPEPDRYLEIGDGAKVGGEPVKGYVSDQHGKRRAVLLGSVSPNAGELDIWLPSRPVGDGDVRVELVRRAPQANGS